MSTIFAKPIRILTPFQQVLDIPWPGQEPVELLFAKTAQDVEAQISDMDVLLAFTFNKAMAANANQLKLIQCLGAGYDKIDFSAVPENCPVANVYEHENPIAEWVLMSMIALDRELIAADKQLRSGNWQMSAWHNRAFPELEGRTIGIIGFGHIGQRIAELARAFRMQVITATRTPPDLNAAAKADAVYGMNQLARVLQASDFVVLCLPLNPGSKRLIGEKQLAMMRHDACLVNVSRADIVDEQALYSALKHKHIKAAALDAWYIEPDGPDQSPLPATQPFWQLDNVIMSPHVSGLTDGLLQRRVRFAAENIDRLARGEPLLNVIHG